MATVNVTDDSFEVDVLKSGKPVIVDFWAEWCAPCIQIGPALEELSDEFADKVTIAKMNVDDNPHTQTVYGVRGFPTMLMFKDGEMAAIKVGAAPKSKIAEWIAENA